MHGPSEPHAAHRPGPGSSRPDVDHGATREFVDYSDRESLSARTQARFRTIKAKALGLLSRHGRPTRELRVADIGCGAGTQAMLWAEEGHRVRGLDVNAPLVAVARSRAAERGLPVTFDVGTATALPYGDASMEVCLLPELLEHVADWQSCLNEAVRVLAPGGVLYLSTTNALCPVQQEFNLPLYSWYPGRLKRRFERLAVTTRPALANHATYPAVHWFTFYSLRDYLAARGLACHDRFDMMDLETLSGGACLAVTMARALPPVRFIGHMCTEGTAVFALKESMARPHGPR